MFAWFGGRKPAWKKKNIKNFWKNDSLGEFFSILYIPSKRDVLSLAHCRLWYWKSSSRESYAEEWEPWLLWCCIVEPAHMNLHRLGMACLYLDWPMRILSGMSFLLILGLFAKDKVLILFGCSSECSAVDDWEVHGRAELDAAGFIRAEENDKQTNIKKFVENFTFFVKIRHIIYAIQNRLSCEPAFVYVLHIQCEYRDKLHLLILWKA